MERVRAVRIYDGEKLDTTNFSSEKYIEINSCGVQNVSLDFSVTIREKGRADYHLLLISMGCCEVFYKGESYILQSGDMVVYPPRESQKYIFSPQTTSLFCHFTGSAAHDILNDYGISFGVIRNLQSGAAVYEKFMELIRSKNGDISKNKANRSFFELLNVLSEEMSVPKEKNRIGVDAAVDYIHVNYNKHITLDSLASVSGYSKSRFSKLFFNETGSTPIEYINVLRLENARRMLLSSRLSIGEVAEACGFGDQLYFCRLFKKKYQISPSVCREGCDFVTKSEK